MIEAIISALTFLANPYVLAFVLLGTLLGLLFGTLPGLGGGTAIALLIPITFGMDPLLAFAILAAAQGGTAFGGSVSAILANIPGTAPNAATLLDGYPMTKQGRGAEALGASATASAMGAIFGLLVLVIMIPFLIIILRFFGSVEFFAMGIYGLVVLAVVTKGSMLKGLIAGGMGVAISFVGYNAVTGGRRFTFDILYLYDGIHLIPTLIGLFAISEMIHLLSKQQRIVDEISAASGGVLTGIKSVFSNFWLFVRCSLIGLFIGIIPAVGGTIANFVAYVHAMQTEKDTENFGNGDIRGVVATESANDSKDGGAMIPTITFGIPGSAVWAVMLGALVLHGISPGPVLLNQHLDVVFILIFSLIIANIVTSLLGITLADHLVKLVRIDINILAPIIFLTAFLGAYIIRFEIVDVILVAVVGLIGYLMIKYSFSRIALIIGLVLGPLLEQSFHRSLQISGGSYDIFVSRPVALTIFILALFTLMYGINR